MAKKYLSIIITGVLTVLLLFSCSTEENLNQTPTNLEVEKVKNWFENNSNSLNLKIIQYTKEIEWDKAIISNGEKGQIIEIPITLQDFIATTSSTDKTQKAFHRLLFTKGENGNYACFDLQIITSDAKFDNLDQNFNYYNIKDNFNGYVTLYDPIEQKADYQKFKNGSIWKPLITGKSDADAELTCTYLVWIYEDGHVEIITMLYCEAGGVTGGGAEGGTGGYGGAAGSNTPSSQTSYEIINLLDGRVKCIYDKLMNSNTDFKNAIQKFDGEFPVSHLKLTINNGLDPGVYGLTIPPVDYVTEIQFSETGFGVLSDLGRATVFAHEIIHAEIFRKMLSAAQLGDLDPNNMNSLQQIAFIMSLKDNFPGLYDYYYTRYKSTWNHEMMANHYRNTIADIIQEFDNNRLPRSTYEAVAWLGLGKLDANLTTIAWDNLSSEEKALITKLINENLYNGPSTCN